MTNSIPKSVRSAWEEREAIREFERSTPHQRAAMLNDTACQRRRRAFLSRLSRDEQLTTCQALPAASLANALIAMDLPRSMALLHQLPPVDVAATLQQSTSSEGTALWALMPIEVQATALAAMSQLERRAALAAMPPRECQRVSAYHCGLYMMPTVCREANLHWRQCGLERWFRVSSSFGLRQQQSWCHLIQHVFVQGRRQLSVTITNSTPHVLWLKEIRLDGEHGRVLRSLVVGETQAFTQDFVAIAVNQLENTTRAHQHTMSRPIKHARCGDAFSEWWGDESWGDAQLHVDVTLDEHSETYLAYHEVE